MPVADDIETRVERLGRLVEALVGHVEGVDEARLAVRPGPGEWSAMEVLAHAAEYLRYWARQAREVAARELPSIPFGRTHDDPDRVAAVERHAADPLPETVARVRESLRECLALLRSIPPERWSRSGRHARRGEMTVDEIVEHFLLRHTEEHAAQAEAALRSPASR